MKTTFAYSWPDRDQEDAWELIDDQAELSKETLLEQKADRMAVMIHPVYYEDTANYASISVDTDHDFEKTSTASAVATTKTSAHLVKVVVSRCAINVSPTSGAHVCSMKVVT